MKPVVTRWARLLAAAALGWSGVALAQGQAPARGPAPAPAAPAPVQGTAQRPAATTPNEAPATRGLDAGIRNPQQMPTDSTVPTQPAAEPVRTDTPARLDMQLVRRGNAVVLQLQGPFAVGDASRFEQILSSTPNIREVVFNSPGGSVEDGLRIGRMIRSRRMATRVPTGGMCASICTMAFLGGVVRKVDVNANYCVHMFRVGDPDVYGQVTALIQQGGTDVAGRLIEDIQGRAALVAAAWARYLIEMQVSLRIMTPTFRTSTRGVYCLEQDELRDYVVVNVD